MNAKVLDYFFSILYFFIAFYGFRIIMREYTGNEHLSLPHAILSGVVGGVAVAVLGLITRERSTGVKIVLAVALFVIVFLIKILIKSIH